MKIFVYGTLKMGFWNHRFLNKYGGAKLLGKAKVNGYDLYESVIPFAVEGQGIVTGEVYEVCDQTLLLLDKLEGVSVGLYKRELVTANLNDSTDQLPCFIYLYLGDVSDVAKLESGTFTAEKLSS